MSWIESHQELRGHPKMKKAARTLGLSHREMVGHLHFLWWWALDYAPDGDLTGYSAEVIAADGADWPGDPQQFLQALIDCRIRPDKWGFIEAREDGRLLLHDWYQYAGKLLKRRADNAERMREARALAAEENAGEHAEHVQRTCNARAGATNRTNRTNQQNLQTVDSAANAAAASPVEQIYAYYKSKIQPDARLTDKARTKIKARITNGYGVDRLMLAIDHFAADWWSMENNGGRGMAFFFDNDDRIEQYLHMKPRPKPASNDRNEPSGITMKVVS